VVVNNSEVRPSASISVEVTANRISEFSLTPLRDVVLPGHVAKLTLQCCLKAEM
jgi:hypothetical protein